MKIYIKSIQEAKDYITMTCAPFPSSIMDVFNKAESENMPLDRFVNYLNSQLEKNCLWDCTKHFASHHSIDDFTPKQLIAILAYYTCYINNKKDYSFSDFLDTVAIPEYENSRLYFVGEDGLLKGTIENPFRYLYESEEKKILEKLSEVTK